MGNNSSSTPTPEEFPIPIFKVEMVAIGGKFRGMLGATYNIAYDSTAYRLPDDKAPIRYGDESKGEEDNIYMDVYFVDHSDSAKFIKEAKGVHRVHDLINRDHNPTFKSSKKGLRMKLSQLVQMDSDDFEVFTPPGSINYDQSSQNLGSFETSRKRSRYSSASNPARSSGRLSSSLSTTARTAREFARAMLFEWQSLEKKIPQNFMYSCHLLGKEYTGVTVQSHPDNFVGAYGDFYNGLDGLQSPDRVPRFVLDFVRAEETFEEAEDGVRQKVWLRLRFRDDKMADIWFPKFKQTFKERSTFDEGRRTIESFVHVRSALEFENMVNVKKTLTETKWKTFGFL